LWDAAAGWTESGRGGGAGRRRRPVGREPGLPPGPSRQGQGARASRAVAVGKRGGSTDPRGKDRVLGPRGPLRPGNVWAPWTLAARTGGSGLAGPCGRETWRLHGPSRQGREARVSRAPAAGKRGGSTDPRGKDGRPGHSGPLRPGNVGVPRTLAARTGGSGIAGPCGKETWGFNGPSRQCGNAGGRGGVRAVGAWRRGVARAREARRRGLGPPGTLPPCDGGWGRPVCQGQLSGGAAAGPLRPRYGG
jgi:hypothetical protein